ncbi:MAG: MBL fold metallo-hydrolase [Alphaproteobacteria bacterium]|nr:MBL fold metallo-hydrolase [Alphaproteobacteria bacterium]
MLVLSMRVLKGPFINYCYLVMDSYSKDAVLIDPAWQMDKIENAIDVNHAKLIGVLLTHHHRDHVNLADAFAQRYDVPVFMSDLEINHYGFQCSNLKPITPSSDLQLGTITVRPIPTPGHTKGAICYWIDGALFTGDTLFIEGCGICTGPGASSEEMYASLDTLKSTLPPECIIYPGHSYGYMPGQPFSFLLRNNIYLSFQTLEDFVAFRMRKGQTSLLNFK